MINNFKSELNWIAGQHEIMIDTLCAWSNINSCYDNVPGLTNMLHAISPLCEKLKPIIEEIALPPRSIIDNNGKIELEPLGKAIRLRKHQNAPLQVFLGGHTDTVYPAASSFQHAERISKTIMRGPGVADMKGGLLVMLYALQALERSQAAGSIGWEVIMNPDEEIGSPGSEALFIEAAARNDLGLVFEPAYPDGALVSSRKGSANFTVVAHGKSAHAGRDFHQGRNAITALAKLIVKMEALTEMDRGIAVNVGHITGGGPVNIVPDLAIAKINIRIVSKEDLDEVVQELSRIIQEANKQEGLSFGLHEQTKTPPKQFDDKIQALFAALNHSAATLGMPLTLRESGGSCDGSRLYAEGLPNIDTLGVVGGNIHTQAEYVELDSLKDKAMLVALFLLQLASREIEFKY